MSGGENERRRRRETCPTGAMGPWEFCETLQESRTILAVKASESSAMTHAQTPAVTFSVARRITDVRYITVHHISCCGR